MRARYSSRVYRRCIRSSTRVEPDWTGRCTWSQITGLASMASTIDLPKSRGWLVAKRTRFKPGVSATRASRPAKSWPAGEGSR